MRREIEKLKGQLGKGDHEEFEGEEEEDDNLTNVLEDQRMILETIQRVGKKDK